MMKLIVRLFFCLFLFSCGNGLLGGSLKWGNPQKAFPAKWFNQTLDHFDALDDRKFKQRYYENDQFWNQNNGPIFLVISGEGPCYGPPSGENSEVVQLAKRFQGLIVTLEHRYYGLSVPFQELTTKNLQYLSSRQALNDLADFIQWYSTNTLKGRGNKWFTIGGSYSGALSAWFRLKYPHLTSGSLSSSGVVNAILDFVEFDEQVSLSVGSQCADILRSATKQVEQQMNAGEQSKKQVKQLFGAEMLEEDGDFYYLLADCMAESVQYGFQEKLCNTFVEGQKQGLSLVDVYANYTKTFFYKTLGSVESYCTAELQKTSWKENTNYRQWWFQKCSELAYFQNAPEVNSVRSRNVNMDYHRKHCNDVFGNNLWPDTNATNAYYGGDKIAATKVFFSNGSQDPWKRASVTSTLSLDEPSNVIECENCGHCVDLGGCPGGCANEESLLFGRDLIEAHVDMWLNF